MTSTLTTSRILGADGQPWPVAQDASSKSAVTKTFSSYTRALVGIGDMPTSKAREPLHNHAWVFAAAMIKAVNMAQAPFTVYRETVDAQAKRRATYKAGERREAIARHARASTRFRGAALKELEPAYQHPLATVLRRPNPYLSEAQMWQLISLWLSLRGECIMLAAAEDGEHLPVGSMPAELWPLSPDLFEPVLQRNRLVGWWMRSCKGAGVGLGHGERMFMLPHEIVQFKYPDPSNPIRGISPIAAAASGIVADLLAREHNRATLENGGDPGGVLAYEGELEPKEEDELLAKWEQRHKGTANKGRTGILRGGLSYQPTGLTPKDMDYLETLRWDRDEIFAVLRVPKSTAGVTESLNYATQLGQDRNLWDKGILPDIRMIEDAIDGTLLYPETDEYVGLFDLSNIEALRVGASDQIDVAKKLMAADVHMPPVVALTEAGLTMPRYEGDEVSLVTPLLVPLNDVLNPLPPEEPAPTDEPADEETLAAAASLISGNYFKAKSGQTWKAFIQVQSRIEKPMRLSWQQWLAIEKREQLQRFDSILGKRYKSFVLKVSDAEINAVLVELGDMQKRLKKKYRPLYSAALESTFELSQQELGGIPVFAIDDPKLISVLDKREARLIGTAPKTLQQNLRSVIRSSLESGETIQAMRKKVSQVFDIIASSAKSLQVARTESAGFMNSVRDEMFDLQGFDQEEWVTAGDEVVRASHVFFGEQGAQKRGTNFLALKGYPGKSTGSLEFPGDPAGPASEVINCRCMKIPVG